MGLTYGYCDGPGEVTWDLSFGVQEFGTDPKGVDLQGKVNVTLIANRTIMTFAPKEVWDIIAPIMCINDPDVFFIRGIQLGSRVKEIYSWRPKLAKYDNSIEDVVINYNSPCTSFRKDGSRILKGTICTAGIAGEGKVTTKIENDVKNVLKDLSQYFWGLDGPWVAHGRASQSNPAGWNSGTGSFKFQTMKNITRSELSGHSIDISPIVGETNFWVRETTTQFYPDKDPTTLKLADIQTTLLKEADITL